jgi:hypothetical protein
VVVSATTARREPIPAPSTTAPHAMTAPKPLIDRIADAIAKVDDEGLTNMTWRLHAKAALHATTAWINERELSEMEKPDCFEESTSGDVVRWLMDELGLEPDA